MSTNGKETNLNPRPKVSSEHLSYFVDGRISAVIGTFYASASDKQRGTLNQITNDSQQADIVIGEWFSEPHKRAKAANLAALKSIRALHRAGAAGDDDLSSVVWLQSGIKGHHRKIDQSIYDTLVGFMQDETGYAAEEYEALQPFETHTVLQTETYTIVRISNRTQAVYAAHETSANFVAQQFGCETQITD